MNSSTQYPPNRLIHESSPYLRQHAHNPVDWFAWNDEAFAKARAEHKPIFLSIGYSTCHWCHVMAHESFENAVVADVLNQYFVAIKVDREERPDLDKIYMTATQATTGSGGWPMSVWLTHDLRPFFCGTYFPPATFQPLLLRIHEVWKNHQADLVAKAGEITDTLTQFITVNRTGPAVLDDAPLRLGLEQFRANYDATHGGFGGAPKLTPCWATAPPRSAGLMMWTVPATGKPARTFCTSPSRAILPPNAKSSWPHAPNESARIATRKSSPLGTA